MPGCKTTYRSVKSGGGELGRMADKKPYQKPKIKAVKLVPEEAVLGGGCKITFTGVGGGSKCIEGAGGCVNKLSGT